MFNKTDESLKLKFEDSSAFYPCRYYIKCKTKALELKEIITLSETKLSFLVDLGIIRKVV